MRYSTTLLLITLLLTFLSLGCILSKPSMGVGIKTFKGESHTQTWRDKYLWASAEWKW